jgi:putative hydrolase of the HAD superfamily
VRPVVTFDAGQTLVGLDLDFLAGRLAERGVAADPAALAAALPAAWRHHDAEVRAGVAHPWHALMEALLAGAGVAAAEVGPVVAWLWAQQPRRNLWRAPIAGMRELTAELAAAGVRLAVLSNSEGRVAELLAEVGMAAPFAAIIDSGVVGVAKPDPRIFALTLAALDQPADAPVIHIGDSWAADVAGARAVGWRAVWFGAGARPVDDPGVACAVDAAQVRAALVGWGAL